MAMKKLVFLIVLLAVTVANQVQAASAVLPLKAKQLQAVKLDSIPPWPAEMVLKGANEHALKVLHKGELVVTIYSAEPGVIKIIEPYPYDEFVLVLEGQVTLIPIDGDAQTYLTGESFLVPKGWQGTWDMPYKFREMIIVETKAWVAAEE